VIFLKLKVKDMDISTGKTLVAILHKVDAKKLDLHVSDRIRITKGLKSTIAVLDIANSKKTVPLGSIGLFEEVLKRIKAKDSSNVKIFLEEKPKSLYFIRQKLKGRKLKKEEIESIIKDLVNNNLSQVELTYFISGCFVHGLDLNETVNLTKSIINSGDVLKWNKKIVLDKHCIGGIPGNRTTPIVVSILMAAGYTVPKTSSRSITSPAGTADTMEVLTKVDLNAKQIKKVVTRIGGCMTWGGGVNLAPADDAIIKVERPLSIDSEGNLLSSILAKKGSVGATHVLIDIPIGKTAKVKTREHALHLKREFEKIGNKIGMKILVLITNGSKPIGQGIGPSLEAIDLLYVLKNDSRAPLDLKKKSIELASEMLYFVRAYNSKTKNKSKKYFLDQAKKLLESGAAWNKMRKVIIAQGKKIDNPDKINLAKFHFDYKAKKSGKIISVDNKTISKIARIAGAPEDNAAGIFMYKNTGNKIKKGDTIFRIYAENKTKLKYAKEFLIMLDGIKIK
jgi:thymidine phosphorylase